MRKNIGYEGFILEILPQAKEEIDKTLREVLSSREAEVIRNRFGLDTEPKTLREIAENLVVSRERVREIEYKAIKKLRKKYLSFSFLVSSPARTILENLQSKIKVKKMRGLLSLPISELELSLRSFNCLQDANIKIVADLVTRTEEDLLRLRNFGKKSLAEIKYLLENLSLFLGMKLPKEFKPLQRVK